MIDIAEAKQQLEDEGYCVLPGELDAAVAERLDEQARELMAHREGYVSMEASLNYLPDLVPLCIHPPLMELAESILGAGLFLANNVAMKWCKPGAPAGPLHWGGRFQQYECLTELQVFWMLTDFTEANGATRVIPFTHHANRSPRREAYPQEIPVLGKKGTLFIFDGRVWHRSGANTSTTEHRMAGNMMYLPSYAERGEEWPLVTRATYDGVPPQLQSLLERSAEPIAADAKSMDPRIWTLDDPPGT